MALSSYYDKKTSKSGKVFDYSVNIIDKQTIIIYYIQKKKGGKSMDFIQRTMTVFDELIQRVKTIGVMLTYNYLPATTQERKTSGLFWIFNW